MRLRLLSASLALALLLAGSPAFHAVGATGVSLRYHFVAGTTITYSVTDTAVLTQTETDLLPVLATDTQSYLVHYTFSNVTSNGAALLTLFMDQRLDRVTQDGDTTSTTTPPLITRFVQQADGRQYTADHRYYGAYSNGDLGSLPAHPVAVGSHWKSTLTDHLSAFMPGATMRCRNTLIAIAPGADRVATIQTACSLHGRATLSSQGTLYHLAVADSLNGRWQFAVTSGRFLSQVLYETSSQVGTATDAQGTHRFSEHLTSTVVQQFLPGLGPIVGPQ